ncbi:MAG: DUF1553 domain-containing protein [Leptospirales bacterium]|nr:DUF1553 domain-containing protein [Leptospirales bacterium]
MRTQRLILSLLGLFIALGSLASLVGREIQDVVSKHPLDTLYGKLLGRPVRQADSATVLRRMSLQLRGTIPGYKEIVAYEKADPEGRDLTFAVDYLRSPEFANYWGMYFDGLFRDQTNGWKIPFGAFYKYLSESLHENKPYDVLVRELILSTGSPDKNPAVYFYVRDGADPLQTAEYVGRLFYARRVGCARCHDHPFDEGFTRRDYYALGAFFSQQFIKWDSWNPNHLNGTAVPWEVRENLPDADRKSMEQAWHEWNQENWNKWTEDQRRAYQKQYEVAYGTVFYQPRLGLRFPRTDDEPGGDLVKPKFLDGTTPKIKEGEDRRAVFAAWLTDKKNDRFRKVMINRIWTRLMGWSFFTPLDDWNASTKIQGEEILNHLDQVFVEKQFRIKDLILYIVTSDAYQRQSPEPGAPDKDSKIAYYQAPRMDADQLMNSLIRASQMQTIGDIWEQRRLIPIDDEGKLHDIDLKGIGKVKVPTSNQRDFSSSVEVQRPVNYDTFLAIFGSGPRRDISDDDNSLSIEQVLALMNGRLTGRIVWDFGSNKNSFIYQEYQRSKDMDAVMDLMYMSTLSRHILPEEKAELKKMTQNKYVTTVDDNQNVAIMNDLIWAMINSQEFLHVR